MSNKKKLSKNLILLFAVLFFAIKNNITLAGTNRIKPQKIQKKCSLFSIVKKTCLSYLAFSPLSGGNIVENNNDTSSVRFMVRPKKIKHLRHKLGEQFESENENDIQKMITSYSDDHSSKVNGNLVRQMGNGFQLFEIKDFKNSEERDDLIKKVADNPDIEDLIVDFDVHPYSTDPYYKKQWFLHSSPGINVEEAWSQGVTGKRAIIAIVDTGIVDHKELNSEVIGGYDFISDKDMANDNDADFSDNNRDSDYSDPGDAVDDYECGLSLGTASTWHGTHVAGIAAAPKDNGEGGSGVAPDAKILVVRALGKCGGSFSDILDGVFWAAGYNIPNVPTNENPAHIINLSLGGSAECSPNINKIFKELKDNGVIVVAASGNAGNSLDRSPEVPAACEDVFTVAATGSMGKITSYSNTGSMVDLAAPGGDTQAGIIAPADGGLDAPNYDDAYRSMIGTSMAAPVVSGAFALLLELNNNENNNFNDNNDVSEIDVSKFICAIDSLSTRVDNCTKRLDLKSFKNVSIASCSYDNSEPSFDCSSGSSIQINKVLFVIFVGLNTISYFL